MKNRFHIFWFGVNGPNWIKAVETLETLKTKLRSCLSTTAVATRSLTTEPATVFLLPRSVARVELGLSKVLSSCRVLPTLDSSVDGLGPTTNPQHIWSSTENNIVLALQTILVNSALHASLMHLPTMSASRN
jgi:hypothetical protein